MTQQQIDQQTARSNTMPQGIQAHGTPDPDGGNGLRDDDRRREGHQPDPDHSGADDQTRRPDTPGGSHTPTDQPGGGKY